MGGGAVRGDLRRRGGTSCPGGHAYFNVISVLWVGLAASGDKPRGGTHCALVLIGSVKILSFRAEQSF